jgi:hypothetical protein
VYKCRVQLIDGGENNNGFVVPADALAGSVSQITTSTVDPGELRVRASNLERAVIISPMARAIHCLFNSPFVDILSYSRAESTEGTGKRMSRLELVMPDIIGLRRNGLLFLPSS